MYAKEIGIPQIPRVIVLIPQVIDEDSQTPQNPKSPQATIRITQNGCTLSFPQPFSLDILVELRDANGNVVYSDGHTGSIKEYTTEQHAAKTAPFYDCICR